MGGTAGEEPVAITKRRALMRWSPATTVSRRDELGGGPDHLDAEAGEPLHRVVGGDGGDDAVDVVVHALVADRRVGRHDAERRRGAHEVGAPRRGDQRLGGNAAVVQAVAAHLVLLDQHHRRRRAGPPRPPPTGRPSRRRSRTDRRAASPPAVVAERLLLAVAGMSAPLAAGTDPHQADRAVIWLLHGVLLHFLTATGMSATTPSSTSASTSSLVTSELA